MQAKDSPISTGSKEFHTDEVKITQRKARNLDLPPESETLIDVSDGLRADDAAYHSELAFMEEPVTIRIQPSMEKFAPKVVQCWVNGKGAEQLTNGKWMQCGWLPVNHVVTTRRKYVEVLARAKQEGISTRVVKHEDSEDNFADRYTSMKYPFSVLSDANPRGHEWLSRILMGQ